MVFLEEIWDVNWRKMSIKSDFFPFSRFSLKFLYFILQRFDVDIFNHVLEHTSLQQHVVPSQWCVFRRQSLASTPALSRPFLRPCVPPGLRPGTVRFNTALPAHLVLLLNSQQKSTCSPSFKIDHRLQSSWVAWVPKMACPWIEEKNKDD